MKWCWILPDAFSPFFWDDHLICILPLLMLIVDIELFCILGINLTWFFFKVLIYFGFGSVISLQTGRAPSPLVAMPLGFLQAKETLSLSQPPCHFPHRLSFPFFFFFSHSFIWGAWNHKYVGGRTTSSAEGGGYCGHLLLRTRLLKWRTQTYCY